MTEYYLMDMVRNEETNDQQREDWANNIWLNPMHGFRGDGPQPKWKGHASGTWLKWIPSIIAGPEEHHLLWHNDDTGPFQTPFRVILNGKSREDVLKKFEHYLFEMPLVLLATYEGIPQTFTAYKGHVAAWGEWNDEYGYDAESFRHGYVKDADSEYRLDYLHAAEGQSIDIRSSTDFEPTWCPNCLHHGLGNTADGDHIACSECGHVEEVKE